MVFPLQYPVTSTIEAGDTFLVVRNTNDLRRATKESVAALVAGLTDGEKVIQYAAPSANDFAVQIIDATVGVWLILTPTGGFAAGEIVLPPLSGVIGGQELLVSSTQSVAALSFDGNGAALSGMPTSLAAGGFFRLRFDPGLSTWYRVGGQDAFVSELGFKNLKQNVYTGVSVVDPIDAGKAHFKTDGTDVAVPNTLPVEFLCTIVNWSDDPMSIDFASSVAYLQGEDPPTPGASWTLAPRNILTINKAASGEFIISGKVAPV